MTDHFAQDAFCFIDSTKLFFNGRTKWGDVPRERLVDAGGMGFAHFPLGAFPEYLVFAEVQNARR